MNPARLMFRKIFNTNSIPVIFIIIGLFSLLLSIWGTFENKLWQDTWSAIGKTILASGVFAGILKLMQISGVFKEELEKLIFEPKFLKNRKDISQYWAKLSQELFNHKFPNISEKVLSDIQHLYLPTRDTIYYDETEHFLDITIDEEDILTVIHTTSLCIICTGKDCVYYEFSNAIDFKEKEDEASYTLDYIKVNGTKIDIDNKTLQHKQAVTGKTVSNTFRLKLEGLTRYEIERKEIKKYPLINDDMMYFRAAKLTNTLKVNISHPKNLNIYFRKTGELYNFVSRQSTPIFKQFEYRGILYKEQGYLIKLKKEL